MGIPSYYSYIIKNHPKILKKLNDGLKVDYLYIDSNSIIYDIVNTMKYNNNKIVFENTLISNVFNKLLDYINLFNNPKNVIIAFDGVAPLAKLTQQRTRRHKSFYLNTITDCIHNDYAPKWSTVAITPGTQFMKSLDNKLIDMFSSYNNVTLYGSDIPGEGEHKLFEHIRNNNDISDDSNIIIYGLDADLIMLGLNHLSYCKNIFLYRENPEYLKDKENKLLNLSMLADAIINQMTDTYNITKLYDYIFLGLLLGNDFMPHFPAINIRTNGIDILLNHYYKIIKNDEYIFNGTEINWKLLRKFIGSLSEKEHEYLLEEYKIRERLSKKYLPDKTIKDKENKLQSIPIYERQDEKYINPYCDKWEERYYKVLFNIYINDTKLKGICKNYLEGLEWNCLYYTTGCPDWNWCYKYHYPPLLKDLLIFIPHFKTNFIEIKSPNPISQIDQLKYVLPKSHLDLLPENVYEEIKDSDWYSNDFEFKWAFCRYIWESHILF